MENNAVEIKDKEEKTPRTTKQKVFLGLKIAGNVVFYAIIIALFLFSIMNINGGNGKDNFPNLFGKGMLSVQSNSMTRVEDDSTWLSEWETYEIGSFSKGDLLIDKVFKKKNADKLKVGDVITFYDTHLEELNTHRIVMILTDADGKVDSYLTQGDYIACITPYLTPDLIEKYGISEEAAAKQNLTLQESFDVQVVPVANVRGVVTSVKVGGGKVLDNIQQNWLLYFVMPVAVLLIFEIFLVVRNIVILRGEKNKAELEGTREQMMADLENEKERMRQELLAEMRAQGLVTADTPAEKPAEKKENDSFFEDDESNDETKIDEENE